MDLGLSQRVDSCGDQGTLEISFSNKLDLLLKARRVDIEDSGTNSSFKEMGIMPKECRSLMLLDAAEIVKGCICRLHGWRCAPAAQICGLHLSDVEYAVADICVASWAPIRACPSIASGQ
jgi:hypothetical protein